MADKIRLIDGKIVTVDGKISVGEYTCCCETCPTACEACMVAVHSPISWDSTATIEITGYDWEENTYGHCDLISMVTEIGEELPLVDCEDTWWEGVVAEGEHADFSAWGGTGDDAWRVVMNYGGDDGLTVRLEYYRGGPGEDFWFQVEKVQFNLVSGTGTVGYCPYDSGDPEDEGSDQWNMYTVEYNGTNCLPGTEENPTGQVGGLRVKITINNLNRCWDSGCAQVNCGTANCEDLTCP